MMPLLSIVVPVYNAEKYLRCCLDTLTRQTYTNIEIICVNDGSSDGSLKILEEYEKQDSRIRIINKVNAEDFQARNSAMSMVSGQYLMFVDADDWIAENTCEIAVNKAIEMSADAILWPYISEHENSGIEKKIFDKDMVFDEPSVKEKLHRRMIGILGEELKYPEKADSLCTVWGKLYKTEIIKRENLKFTDLKEIGTYEDGLFNLHYFEYVRKAVYVDQCLYHYRRTHSDSLTSKYNEKLFQQWQNLFDIMQNYITDKHLKSSYKIALKNRMALSLLGLGLNIMASDLSLKKKLGMLSDILKAKRYREAYQELEFQYMPIHWKVFYGCGKYRFTWGVYVLLMVIKRIIT